MIKAVVHANQRNQKSRAEQPPFFIRVMSGCPVPHKCVYIILISKILFIISCLVDARLSICGNGRFFKVNHLQMLSINRNIRAILLPQYEYIHPS